MFRRMNFAKIFSLVALSLVASLSLNSRQGKAAPPSKPTAKPSVTAATSPASASPAVADDTDAITAICFKQEGSLVGPESVFITQNAIRIDNTARQVITVARAPDWKVTTYSPTAKKFSITELNKYHGQLTHLFLFYGVNMAAYDFHPDHKTKFLEHPALVLKATPNKQDTENTVVTNAFKFYIVADDAKIPVKAADVLARHLCVPVVHQLPLRLDYLTDKMTQRAIDTIKWSNQKIAKTWFDIPSGYARCDKESDVYMEDF